MPLPRGVAKDTLLLFVLTSFGVKRSNNERTGFVTSLPFEFCTHFLSYERVLREEVAVEATVQAGVAVGLVDPLR